MLETRVIDLDDVCFAFLTGLFSIAVYVLQSVESLFGFNSFNAESPNCLWISFSKSLNLVTVMATQHMNTRAPYVLMKPIKFKKNFTRDILIRCIFIFAPKFIYYLKCATQFESRRNLAFNLSSLCLFIRFYFFFPKKLSINRIWLLLFEMHLNFKFLFVLSKSRASVPTTPNQLFNIIKRFEHVARFFGHPIFIRKISYEHHFYTAIMKCNGRERECWKCISIRAFPQNSRLWPFIMKIAGNVHNMSPPANGFIPDQH